MKKIISSVFILVASLLIAPSLLFAESLPSVPVITGPAGTLYTSTSYDFSFVSSDPNNLQVKYEIEYDTGGTNIFVPPFFQYINDDTVQTVTKSWNTAGAHWVRVQATNSNGAVSGWSANYVVNIVAPNSAPNLPVVVNNPSVSVGVPLVFTMTSTDPENDNIKYEIDWNNDGTIDQTIDSSGYIPSGTSRSTNNIWNSAGTYTVKIRATDVKGLSSSWVSKSVLVTVPSTNNPPSVPVISIVPNQGTVYPLTQYDFSFESTDPEGDTVSFRIDWNNDGVFDDSTSYNTSGLKQTRSNPIGTWSTPGTYTFQAFAFDDQGQGSTWGTYSVTVSAAPLPTVTLTASPEYLVPGDSINVHLTWSSTNATSCHSYGTNTWPGSNNTSGTYSNLTPITTPHEYTIVCDGIGGSATSTAAVNFPANLKGWGWSSNIGHISFSSSNTGAGGGSSYGVSVATTSNLGFLSGYAWSSNIGWISFGVSDASHPRVTINSDTGEVTGWARACSGTVSGDCLGASRTDGWDGWFRLSGTNHESPTPDGSRGITFNKKTGKFNGYAWGGDVIGWLTFDSLIVPPVICETCVNITNGGNPLAECTISSSPIFLNSSGGQSTISWTTTNATPNSCSVNGFGYNQSNVSVSGNKTVTFPQNNSTSQQDSYSYVLNCPTETLTCVSKVVVDKKPSTNFVGKMWLDNIQTKTSTTIRPDQSVIVNWDVSGYTNCVGVNRKGNFSTPWFTNGSGSSISGLTKGTYKLGISCDNGKSTNDVDIIVKDSKIEEI